MPQGVPQCWDVPFSCPPVPTLQMAQLRTSTSPVPWLDDMGEAACDLYSSLACPVWFSLLVPISGRVQGPCANQALTIA